MKFYVVYYTYYSIFSHEAEDKYAAFASLEEAEMFVENYRTENWGNYYHIKEYELLSFNPESISDLVALINFGSDDEHIDMNYPKDLLTWRDIDDGISA